LLVVFMVNTIVHLRFADVGWFYRYEAYLVVLGLLSVALALRDPLRLIATPFQQRYGLRYVAIGLTGILFAMPFALRAINSLTVIPDATKNIYEQQFQMATFLQEYYSEKEVAANDIGLIGYERDGRLLDLWGLGSIEVVRAKRSGSYNTETIRAMAEREHTKVAVVYDHWYNLYGGLPREWLKVGTWTVSDSAVLGGNTVTFYAVDPSEAQRLSSYLREYSGRLPAGVEVNMNSSITLAPSSRSH
jgi:hypothetical protein